VFHSTRCGGGRRVILAEADRTRIVWLIAIWREAEASGAGRTKLPVPSRGN